MSFFKQGQNQWYVPRDQNGNGSQPHDYTADRHHGNGPRPAPAPRSPLLRFTDELTDLTRKYGIEIVGTFVIRPVDDETSLNTERYLLEKDAETGQAKVHRGRVKVAMAGVMNGVDTSEFSATLANRVKTLEESGIRFADQYMEKDGIWVVQVYHGARSAERFDADRSKAFDKACEHAFYNKWHLAGQRRWQ